MKKVIIAVFVALFALATTQMHAQEFKKENLVVNAGLGFGWYGYGIGYNVSSTPFLNIGFEKGIIDIPNINAAVSIGGIIGYKHASWDYYGGSFNDYLFATRGAFHIDLFHVDKLDTYAGLTLGFRIHNVNYDQNTYIQDENYVYSVVGLYAGARYYFTNNLAGFAELGTGTGYFNLGLSLKIK